MLYDDVISFFLQRGNVKISTKSMKIVNTEGENIHIFWTVWGISIKFSGKKWLLIILKVKKNQVFTLSLEKTLLEKPHEREPQLTPQPF